MPVQQNCTPCSANVATSVEHNLFLGLSIENFQASVGWNNQSSEFTINLAEDTCGSTGKICYDEQIQSSIISGSDPGFYGEDRWQRPDGSEYSACIAESGADVSIRSAVDLVGAPAYFRIDHNVGSFEYAGIITDWTRTDNCDGIRYTVKMIDPRVILDGLSLIVSEYAGPVVGCVGEGFCALPNVFNVYGYAESFGVPCPAYAAVNSAGTYAPWDPGTFPDQLIDGKVLGANSDAVGGSRSNERGMPLNVVLDVFDILANQIPISNNVYNGNFGRACWYRAEIPASLVGQGCGLIEDPGGGPGCTADCGFYFIDISEVPRFASDEYRIDGPVITLGELLERLSSDFGFDYYLELVLVQPSSGATPEKFIKVRVVDRVNYVSPGNVVCSFIQNEECIETRTVGRELRTEAITKMILGGKKKIVYQAEQNLNPDSAFSGSDTTSTITSPDVINYFNSLPLIRVDSGCDEIDNTIIPYFGLQDNDDIIVPCLNPSPYISGATPQPAFWSFDAPTFKLSQEVVFANIFSSTFEITELELRVALVDFEEWRSFIEHNQTDTFVAFSSTWLPTRRLIPKIFELNTNCIPADRMNPHVKANADKFWNDDPNRLDAQIQKDQETIYNWVKGFADDFYGKRFAVRVPFSCTYPDFNNKRFVNTDRPINDGGWTEMPLVLGLFNSVGFNLSSPTGLTFTALDIFRGDDGRIRPFVRFDDLIPGTDTRHLHAGDYFWSGTSLYVKSNVQEDYVYHDKSRFFGPRVIVELSQSINDFTPKDDEFLADITSPALASGQVHACFLKSNHRAGFPSAVFSSHRRAIMPEAAAIPIENNSTNYGPWCFTPGAVAPILPGKVDIEHKSDMVPWEFGGLTALNSFGVLLAQDATIPVKDFEFGSISYPGLPLFPLGSELGAVGGGYYAGGTNLYENRTIVTAVATIEGNNFDYGLFNFAAWTGSFGPNITRITITGNCQRGFKTTYEMKSFTPRQNRFAKGVIDRFQRVNKQVLEINSNIRSLFNARKRKHYVYEID